MKSLIIAAVAIIVAGTALLAQNQVVPLGSIDAEMLGSFEAEIPVGNARVHWVVVAWRTAPNVTEYTIDATSVLREGAASEFASLSTAQIFDLVGASTIMVGIDSAFAACEVTNRSTGITHVRCVSTTTDGYSAADGNLVRRQYSYTCASVLLTDIIGAGACQGTGVPTTDAGAIQ